MKDFNTTTPSLFALAENYIKVLEETKQERMEQDAKLIEELYIRVKKYMIAHYGEQIWNELESKVVCSELGVTRFGNNRVIVKAQITDCCLMHISLDESGDGYLFLERGGHESICKKSFNENYYKLEDLPKALAFAGIKKDNY